MPVLEPPEELPVLEYEGRYVPVQVGKLISNKLARKYKYLSSVEGQNSDTTRPYVSTEDPVKHC